MLMLRCVNTPCYPGFTKYPYPYMHDTFPELGVFQDTVNNPRITTHYTMDQRVRYMDAVESALRKKI